MDVGISTRCFGTKPLTLDLLERLRRAEFSHIELHAALPSLDYRNKSVLRDIARWFPENAMPAPSLHLPFENNALSADRFERQAALDEFKRCLELHDILPAQYAVLHLGAPGQDYNPVAFEYAYAAIATIQAFSGIRVLMETLPNAIATFARIEEFTKATQLGHVGICYDTGHGEMEGACDAIHLDDTGRETPETDPHLWPFEGERNWPAFVERLTMASYNGPMILEVKNDRLEKAADCRSRLKDLMDEALDSIEEFRLKYKLPAPKREDEE